MALDITPCGSCTSPSNEIEIHLLRNTIRFLGVPDFEVTYFLALFPFRRLGTIFAFKISTDRDSEIGGKLT